MRWHTNVRIGQSGIYPGLALLISSWYRRGELPSLRPYRRKANDEISEEQQLRFAYLQAGEVIILATGNIVNFGVGNFSRQNLFFLFRAPFFLKMSPFCMVETFATSSKVRDPIFLQL